MQRRVVALATLASIFFVILAFRLWELQVLASDDYQSSAQATQTRSVKVPAQRGVIYDRNGEVLANNQSGFNVTVVPNAISRDKLGELANLLKADKKEVLSRYDSAIASRNQYSPMLVKENAGREDVVYVSEKSNEFGGLAVNDDHVRNYSNGQLLAHVLGYTGAVTQEELDSGHSAFKGVDNDAVVGKDGVELSYEETLRGKPGKKEYEVDALGRQVDTSKADGSRHDGGDEEIPELGKPARTTDPAPGKNLKLTIDLNLQKNVDKELQAAIGRAKGKGHAATGGAALAIDPANGEILAMAGKPDFDPQMFVGGITDDEKIKQYEYLTSEEANSPFTNRAVQGAYPGASTFKPFTGLAGFADGAISPSTTVTDTGACWRPTGTSWGCWQSWRENSPKYQFLGPHGTQNYAQALMDSNDKFFYQVADWMWNKTNDKDLLPGYYQQFGFGQKTGVDLPGEAAGRVPTQEWQQKAGTTEDDKLWSVGRWVNLSIGQGDLLVTPLQLIRGYAALANGGTLVTPHVGKVIEDQQGNLIKEISPAPAGSLGVDPPYLQETLRGLK
ncbi:MAG: penicillin-binding transpeptidase domain-containing protein, partial [Actinomycetota bacterium]|nr:penicillin-binding transpeptidase domain-containing protein [Actinomycetota bacterium]